MEKEAAYKKGQCTRSRKQPWSGNRKEDTQKGCTKTKSWKKKRKWRRASNSAGENKTNRKGGKADEKRLTCTERKAKRQRKDFINIHLQREKLDKQTARGRQSAACEKKKKLTAARGLELRDALAAKHWRRYEKRWIFKEYLEHLGSESRVEREGSWGKKGENCQTTWSRISHVEQITHFRTATRVNKHAIHTYNPWD